MALTHTEAQVVSSRSCPFGRAIRIARCYHLSRGKFMELPWILQQRMPSVTRLAIVKGQVADYAVNVALIQEVSLTELADILRQFATEIDSRPK